MELERTTLRALASWDPPPDEVEFFKKIIEILDDVYPEGWRSWEVNDVSFEDLFGKNISADDENRLRYAIPTVRLAEAFGCSTLSERKYRHIKRTLLRWPLGRALIYSPFATMKKIHPTDAYNDFANNILTIKNQLISQKDAAILLKNDHPGYPSTPSTSRGDSVPPNADGGSRKRSHSSDVNLEDLMHLQTKMFGELLMAIKETKHTSRTQYEKSNYYEDSEHEERSEPDDESDGNNWEAPEIVEPDIATEREEENFFDFSPATKETEAKIGTADEGLAKQGSHCQRLGESSWQNIRYAEVQKQFQASPVFTSLKTNSNLATVTPNWQTVALLEKMDACLGAITHGLLQQRKQFQEIYNKASLEIKSHISKNFLATESAFRRTSDSLLQYTCGKRAEIIQQRRSIYTPANKTFNELLHSIPPSNTHLFSEPQLSDLIKEQGGANKFFPFRKHPTSNTSKPKPQYKCPKIQERHKPRFNERRPIFRSSDQSRKRPHASSSSNGKPKKARFEGKPKL